MPFATLKTTKPQIPLAVGIGAAGAAKLAGAQFTKDNFKRWGYADWWRTVIGAVEVGTAAAVLVGLRSPAAQKIGAAGTLSTMGGAIATHLTAGEPPLHLTAPVILAGLGFVTLFQTPDEEPDAS